MDGEDEDETVLDAAGEVVSGVVTCGFRNEVAAIAEVGGLLL